MKRILRLPMLLIMTMLLLPTGTIFAYLFRAPITILEANGTAYTMLPAVFASNNKYMAANDFTASTARDTRVGTLGGVIKPHMVADSVTMTATTLPANGQVNLYFTTGETAADFDIIPGYNGYVTIDDAATLEFASNFECEYSGYVDTSATGVGLNLVYKPAAYRTYIDSVNSITTLVFDAAPANAILLPAGAGGLTNIQTVFGVADHWDAVNDPAGVPDDGATYVSQNIAATNIDTYTTDYPPGTFHPGVIINTITVTIRVASGGMDLTAKAWPVLRLGGANTVGTLVSPATPIYANYSEVLARPGGGSWTVTDLATLQVGVQLEPGTSTSYCTQVYAAINYTDVTALTATPVTSGDHIVLTESDGANWTLSIDGVVADGPDATPSMPGNGNSWVLMSNATPYCHYYKHTVGGVLIAHYAPADIIRGLNYAVGTVTVTNGDATVEGAGGMAWTDALVGSVFISADTLFYTVSSVTDADTLELTAVYAGGTLAGQTYATYPQLVDREGAATNGAMTFGANPAGVTATLGGLVSGSQPAPGISTEDDTPRDLMSEVPVSDWYIDPAVSTTLQTNPFRPLVQVMSDNTPMTEIEGWRVLGGAFILIVFALAATFLRGHYLLVGISTGAAIGACIALTIFPLIFLIGVIICILAGIVAERMQSV